MAQLIETSETGMANRALAHLRKGPITSIADDDSKAGRALRQHFAAVRDGLQRQYPWNFCEDFVSLPALSETPAALFRYFFMLPEDCLYVREIIGCPEQNWRPMSGRRLAANASPPVTIRYSRRVLEVPYWDALFQNAFCLHLALAAAPALTEDETVIVELRQMASEALIVAFPADAAEGTGDEIPDTDWVTHRR